MWNQLSHGLAKYTDVNQLKATAQRLKGQFNEFTNEVLQDIEESEAVAKENIEKYRAHKQQEIEQQQPSTDDSSPSSQLSTHTASGLESAFPNHRHTNGDGSSYFPSPANSTSSGGHFGASFSDFNSPLLDPSGSSMFQPTTTNPVADSTFPITSLTDDGLLLSEAPLEQVQDAHHLDPQSLYQSPSYEHTNGFGQTHPTTGFLEVTHQPPQPLNYSSPSSSSFTNHGLDTTPVHHTYSQHHISAVSDTHPSGGGNEDGGLMVEHTEVISPLDVSFEQTPNGHISSPVIDHTTHTYDQSHSQRELDSIKQLLQQSQHQATQLEQQNQHQQQMLLQLQAALDQSQHEKTELKHQFEQRLGEHAAEVATNQARESLLKSDLAQLSQERQQLNKQLMKLKSDHEELNQRLSAPSTTISSTPISSTETASTTDETIIDVQAVLSDSSLQPEEKISILVDEIEVLNQRVKQLILKSQPPSITPIVTASDSVDVDGRISALQAELDELNSELESVRDEKSMLNDILSELKAESEKTMQEAMERANQRETDLKQELMNVTQDKNDLLQQLQQVQEKYQLTSSQLAQLQTDLLVATQQLESLRSQPPPSISPANEPLTPKKVTLHSILSHPIGHQLFTQHLQGEYSTENIQFYDRAGSFETLDSDQQLQEAGSLIHEFISDDANTQINIPAPVRKELLRQFHSGEITSQMFAPARKEIFQLMSTDSLQRFKATPKFTELLNSAGSELQQLVLAEKSSRTPSRNPTPSLNSFISPTSSIISSTVWTPPSKARHPIHDQTPTHHAHVDGAADLETLQQQYTDLRKSYEKLVQFRTQAIHWHECAESTMAKLKKRKESLQESMKRKEARWLQEREKLIKQIQAITPSNQQPPTPTSTTGQDSNSMSAASTAHNSPLLSSQPTPAIDPTELLRAEHAEALGLLQAQLDLARQQLSMQTEQIQSLQQDLRTSTNTHSADVEQRERELEERIRAEYVLVTDQMSFKIQEVQQQLGTKNEELSNLYIQLNQFKSELADKTNHIQMMQTAANIATQQANDHLNQKLQESRQFFEQRINEMTQQHEAMVQSLQQQLTQSIGQLEATQSQLNEARAAATVAPQSSPDDAAVIQDLQSQLSLAQFKLQEQTDGANTIVGQLNHRYEQLLNSFTALQQRCRDGLQGEEGKDQQIHELQSTLQTMHQTQEQVHAEIDRLRVEVKAVEKREASAKGELTIMSARWKEAVSEADGLRKLMREQIESMNEAREASGGSDMNGVPTDQSLEIRSLKQQIQNLEFDMASLNSLQSDYATLARNYDMSQTMLTEVRENLEAANRQLTQTTTKLIQTENELAQARSSKDELVGEVASTMSHASQQQVKDLEAALLQKSEQLVEMSNYLNRIETDHMNLRKSFESTLSKLKNFTSDEQMVDRRLVVKMLVTFFERSDKDEVLALMTRVLQFTKDDLARIQKGRQGVLGRLGSFLSAPVEHVGGTGGEANLADSWIDFLMQESAKAEAEKAAAASDAANIVIPPTPTSRLEPATTFARESEFESRPSRPAHTSLTTPAAALLLPPPTATPVTQHAPPPSQLPPSPAQQLPLMPHTFLPPPPMNGTSFSHPSPFPLATSGAPPPFNPPPINFPGQMPNFIAPPPMMQPPPPFAMPPPMMNNFQVPPPLAAPPVDLTRYGVEPNPGPFDFGLIRVAVTPAPTHADSVPDLGPLKWDGKSPRIEFAWSTRSESYHRSLVSSRRFLGDSDQPTRPSRLITKLRSVELQTVLSFLPIKQLCMVLSTCKQIHREIIPDHSLVWRRFKLITTADLFSLGGETGPINISFWGAGVGLSHNRMIDQEGITHAIPTSRQFFKTPIHDWTNSTLLRSHLPACLDYNSKYIFDRVMIDLPEFGALIGVRRYDSCSITDVDCVTLIELLNPSRVTSFELDLDWLNDLVLTKLFTHLSQLQTICIDLPYNESSIMYLTPSIFQLAKNITNVKLIHRRWNNPESMCGLSHLPHLRTFTLEAKESYIHTGNDETQLFLRQYGSLPTLFGLTNLHTLIFKNIALKSSVSENEITKFFLQLTSLVCLKISDNYSYQYFITTLIHVGEVGGLLTLDEVHLERDDCINVSFVTNDLLLERSDPPSQLRHSNMFIILPRVHWYLTFQQPTDSQIQSILTNVFQPYNHHIHLVFEPNTKEGAVNDSKYSPLTSKSENIQLNFFFPSTATATSIDQSVPGPRLVGVELIPGPHSTGPVDIDAPPVSMNVKESLNSSSTNHPSILSWTTLPTDWLGHVTTFLTLNELIHLFGSTCKSWFNVLQTIKSRRFKLRYHKLGQTRLDRTVREDASVTRAHFDLFLRSPYRRHICHISLLALFDDVTVTRVGQQLPHLKHLIGLEMACPLDASKAALRSITFPASLEVIALRLTPPRQAGPGATHFYEIGVKMIYVTFVTHILKQLQQSTRLKDLTLFLQAGQLPTDAFDHLPQSLQALTIAGPRTLKLDVQHFRAFRSLTSLSLGAHDQYVSREQFLALTTPMETVTGRLTSFHAQFNSQATLELVTRLSTLKHLSLELFEQDINDLSFLVELSCLDELTLDCTPAVSFAAVLSGLKCLHQRGHRLTNFRLFHPTASSTQMTELMPFLQHVQSVFLGRMRCESLDFLLSPTTSTLDIFDWTRVELDLFSDLLKLTRSYSQLFSSTRFPHLNEVIIAGEHELNFNWYEEIINPQSPQFRSDLWPNLNIFQIDLPQDYQFQPPPSITAATASKSVPSPLLVGVELNPGPTRTDSEPITTSIAASSSNSSSTSSSTATKPKTQSVYFVRHGETTFNIAKRLQGRTQESILTTRGQIGAKLVGRYFKNKNIVFERGFCSQLNRAKQSCQLICEFHPIPIQEEALVNERAAGRTEGKTREEVIATLYTEPKIAALLAQQAAGMDADEYDTAYSELTGVESFQSVRSRGRQFLEQLKACPEQSILVVSHGRFLATLFHMINPEHGEMADMSNCTIVQVEFDPSAAVSYRMISIHDGSHLWNTPKLTYASQLQYPVDHWSLIGPPATHLIGEFCSRGHTYQVYLNPTDCRGYRLIVRLWNEQQPASVLNRPSTDSEEIGLLLVTQFITRALRLIGLVTQIEILGNNAHSFQVHDDRRVVLGVPHEPNLLHAHIISRGDPQHEYVAGVALGGPLPGELFNLRQGAVVWTTAAAVQVQAVIIDLLRIVVDGDKVNEVVWKKDEQQTIQASIQA